MPLLTSLLKLPFKVAGRIGRAVEMAPGVVNLTHPEQTLSKSQGLKKLYAFTVNEERAANLLKRRFTGEIDRIVKTYGINDEKTADQFLSLVEFYNYNKRLPNPQEAARYPKHLFKAAADHLRSIEDPIYLEYNTLKDPKTYEDILKKYNLNFDPATMTKPGMGYVAGHFTHFPVKSYVNFLDDEINRTTKMLQNLDVTDPRFFNYQAHIKELKKTLDEATHIDATLNANRFKQLPKGGHFGPLTEHRKTQKMWGYRKDYKDVMHEYTDGAVRQIFLDRYMPIANELVKAEPNIALRQYAFDYVTAQRGALATKSRIFFNESLAQLFPNPESGYRNIAKGVDFATRFQYLSKIGLSWFRFPFVNASQPILTLYPMVGGRKLLLAYGKDILDPAIWKEARDVGVIFKMQLRKGLVEALGRTPKLSAFERAISAPAALSEELNRVVSYAAGKRQAIEMGLKGEDVIDHAIRLVNRTQFLYSKAGMPLIMSKSPVGRLLFQFRTFTSNYINYLTQLWREKNYTAFAKALGSLGALSGTAVVPFGLWKIARDSLLRNAGVDIGEFNPVAELTERVGFSPPLDLGQSFEPFNIPSEVTQMFGPTIGPVLKLIFDWQRKPEEAKKHFQRFGESFLGPPVVRAFKGVAFPTVRTEPTKTRPKGRVLGRRSLAESMFLRSPLESTRRKYMGLMANAMVGGRQDLVRGYMARLRQMNIDFKEEDFSQVKSMASKLKGVIAPPSP